jgi:3-oxoadipate enol-lactonase
MPDGAALELGAVLEGEIGLPVLVLGNSIGTSTALWEPQLAVLGRRFRLLRFDWPGHGGPEPDAPPPGPYSIGALGRGVLALLDRYQIREAAYAGVSLGGMVGMWIAAHAPDRVTRLALCCTSAYLDLDWAQRAATVRSQGMGPVADRTADRWFTAAYQHREPGVVSRIVGEMREVTPEGYAGCCDAIGAMDQRPELPAITAPTLVIAGNEDPATPPWHGAVIARGIPDARLAVVRGASHLASVSQAGEVTALLAGHLAG